MTADKQAAYDTLYTALTTFAQVLAPFMPFLTEEIHQRLVVAVNAEAPQSVHWCDYPQADESLIDAELETGMSYARRIVALGRNYVKTSALKSVSRCKPSPSFIATQLCRQHPGATRFDLL